MCILSRGNRDTWDMSNEGNHYNFVESTWVSLAWLYLETDEEQELIIWNIYFLNKEEKKIPNQWQEHIHWGRL